MFNQHKINQDAFEACMANTVCKNMVFESNSEILNYLITDAYNVIETTSMTNVEWE